jgi:amino acid transporter
MNGILKWVKRILFDILFPALLIIYFKFLLNININILRIILIYILVFIFDFITWNIKKKKVKFTLIKYSVFITMLCWGITCATLMTLLLNNPFSLRVAIINYLLFLSGGFLSGIIIYKITKYFEKKKQQKIDMENNKIQI